MAHCMKLRSTNQQKQHSRPHLYRPGSAVINSQTVCINNILLGIIAFHWRSRPWKTTVVCSSGSPAAHQS